MSGYEKYLKEMGIDKSKPVKIEFDERMRAFHCPICNTGTAVDTKKCSYCEQLLLSYWS